MMSLTPKQSETLAFIRRCIDTDGIAPSYEEMRVALDLASRSGVHRLVLALEQRGAIRRFPHHSRAIEIIEIIEPESDLGWLDRKSNAELYRIGTRCHDIIKGRAG